MTKTETKFTSDDKDIIAAMRRQEQQLLKLQERYAQLAQKSQQGAKQEQGNLSSVISGLAQKAAAYLTVREAINQVITALERKAELEKTAADEQVAVADAERSMLLNLGSSDPQMIARAQQVAREISSQTGLALKDTFAAMGDALSARGAASVEEAFGAVRGAASTSPHDPEAAQAMAGAVLDLAKMTGTAEADTNLGFLLGVSQTSRVTNLQALSKNVVPAMIGVQGFGGTSQESAAIVSAMAAATPDAKGSSSGTAAIALAEQLEKFLPELSSTLERVRALQGDASLREEFLDESTFEKKAITPVRELLEGGEAARILEAALPQIPAIEKAAAIYRERLAAIDALPTQQLAGSTRRGAVIAEDARAAGEREFSGAALKTVEDMQRATETGLLRQQLDKFQRWRISAADDPIEASARHIEERLEFLEAELDQREWEAAWERGEAEGPQPKPRVATRGLNAALDGTQSMPTGQLTELIELTRASLSELHSLRQAQQSAALTRQHSE